MKLVFGRIPHTAGFQNSFIEDIKKDLRWMTYQRFLRMIHLNTMYKGEIFIVAKFC